MLETGVRNLDLLLGGGIPEGDLLLVVGPAGSGKTTITVQAAFHTAAQGRNVIYSATLSETPTRLLRHIETYSFYNAQRVGKQMFFLDIYPLIRLGLEKVTDALVDAVKQHQAALLVVDGLMTLNELSPVQGADMRKFIYDLGAALHPLNCTTVMTSSGTEQSERHSAAFTIADGIIELELERLGTRTVRTIEPRKMRGTAPLLGRHTLRIDGDGAAVFPRLESRVTSEDAGLSLEREPTGLAELDRMLAGGLPVGSVTGLAGALGAGKTLLSLHYAMEGVRRGEKVMIAGFRETPRQLIDKARSFDMDLGQAETAGQVLFFHRPAVDLVVDEVTDTLLDDLERFGPARLVVDSYGDLAFSLAEERRRAYMAALAIVLRNCAVTALFTVETAQIPSPQLDFSDTPLALLAQNFLLLRYVEFRGALQRMISILKMRDSGHDGSIRECFITPSGLSVLPAGESGEGVLRDLGRLPRETGARRRDVKDAE